MLEGQDATPDAKFPEEEYLYFFCAKEFGWTINETDEQPIWMLDWVYQIAQIVRQVENDKQQSAFRNETS